MRTIKLGTSDLDVPVNLSGNGIARSRVAKRMEKQARVGGG